MATEEPRYTVVRTEDAFENRYFAQLHRCYHPQPPDDEQLPLPLEPPF